jgi:trk system potassium uptake protein TrkH
MSPPAGTSGGLAPGPALISLVVGGTLAASGAGMVLVAGLALLGDGREAVTFALTGAAILATGLAAVRLGTGQKGRRTAVLTPYLGFLSVALAWVAAAVAGAIPLLLAGIFTNPADAFFEAMSGFTTAGATLLEDYDVADAVLWWRSVMQYLGGIGIVVLVVAIAPVTGTGLQGVFYAEVSGVTNDRLTPRIIDTAKILSGVYLTLTAAACTAYLLAGMDGFEAANHAMTTLATGGFSTNAASIAGFDSVAIEIVAIVFMALAGINFAFYWRAMRGRDLMPQLAEVRVYFGMLVAAIAIVSASLLIADDVSGVGETLRQAAFSTTSVMTGTGYVTADFDGWNDFARVGILFLMFVGACAGSTAGGIKVIRLTLLAKTARQELERQLKPSAIQVLRMGGRTFSEDVRRAVLGFFLLYVLVYTFGALAMAATGVDPITALSASATSINIVGPGLGEIGATDSFGAIPEEGRMVAAFLMLTGRLEIFTIVALFAPLLRKRSRGF